MTTLARIQNNRCIAIPPHISAVTQNSMKIQFRTSANNAENPGCNGASRLFTNMLGCSTTARGERREAETSKKRKEGQNTGVEDVFLLEVST